MTTDNREFTVLGHPYRMLDPNTFGADVRIQQARKVYFERAEGIGEEEPRASIRERYELWLENDVTDTSLDDVLTLCALLTPVAGSPALIPETLLEASTWQMREEMKGPMGFFTSVRDLSLAEYQVSLQASKITPEASTPTTESST